MSTSVTTVLIILMRARFLAITRVRCPLRLLQLDRMFTLKALRAPLQRNLVIRVKSIGRYGLGDLRLFLLGLLASRLSMLDAIMVIAISVSDISHKVETESTYNLRLFPVGIGLGTRLVAVSD